MKRVYQYLLLGLGLLAGCHHLPDETSVVKEYFDLNGIILQNNNYNTIMFVSGHIAEKFSSSVNTEKYIALCNKYNDRTYDVNKVGYENYAIAISNVFTNIEVVSDSDFDELHLAGNSLNDVLKIATTSIYPFIKSGYQFFDWNTFAQTNPDFALGFGGMQYPIDKQLSDIEQNDMIMMGHPACLFWLYWLSTPTITQNHNITITMTTDDGRVFSDTAEVNWE